jgi:hypothetical protein
VKVEAFCDRRLAERPVACQGRCDEAVAFRRRISFVWICALRDDGKAASRRAAEASEEVEQIQSAALLVTGGAHLRSLPHLWFSGNRAENCKNCLQVVLAPQVNFAAGRREFEACGPQTICCAIVAPIIVPLQLCLLDLYVDKLSYSRHKTMTYLAR